MSLTATIAGVSVSLQEGALSRPDRIDQRTACTVTVIDLAGTALYQRGQPIVITDSILGTIFTGYVNQPQATKLYPNPGLLWTLDCIDKEYLAGKRTSNKTYANQYSGTVAVDQIQRYLAGEGITAKAALRWDELQTDWAAGTLSGTVATTNVTDGNPGDGDLELASGGSPASFIIDNTNYSNTSHHTFSNTIADTDGIRVNSMKAIQYSADCTIAGVGNAFLYTKIYGGGYTIVSTDIFQYDIWIAKAAKKTCLLLISCLRTAPRFATLLACLTASN